MLLRYSTFHISRSSSIEGHLSFDVILLLFLRTLWFDPISLSFNFEYDPTIGSKDMHD